MCQLLFLRCWLKCKRPGEKEYFFQKGMRKGHFFFFRVSICIHGMQVTVQILLYFFLSLELFLCWVIWVQSTHSHRGSSKVIPSYDVKIMHFSTVCKTKSKCMGPNKDAVGDEKHVILFSFLFGLITSCPILIIFFMLIILKGKKKPNNWKY